MDTTDYKRLFAAYLKSGQRSGTPAMLSTTEINAMHAGLLATILAMPNATATEIVERFLADRALLDEILAVPEQWLSTPRRPCFFRRIGRAILRMFC
jgi:hypothetical protein